MAVLRPAAPCVHFDCVSLRLGGKHEWTVSSSPLGELILLWVLQKHGAEARRWGGGFVWTPASVPLI